MPTTTKYQITKQIEALNKHDPQAFTASYATDATIVDPQYPEPLKGRDQIRKDITDFLKAFPDLRFTLDTVVERDDTLAFEGIMQRHAARDRCLDLPAKSRRPTNRSRSGSRHFSRSMNKG